MRRLLVSLVTLMLLAGTGPAAVAMQAASPAASPVSMNALINQIAQGQVCAWPATVGIGAGALNVAYPDTHAAYFVMPYILAPGQSLVLHGTYPFARFSSLVTYYRQLVGGHGLDLLGWLTDAAITPDAGSANPAVDPHAATDPAHRRWTVRITGTGTPSATPTVAQPVNGENVLPAMLADASNTLGILALRIYAPTDASDPAGGVALPTISLETAGASRTLSSCTEAETQTWTGFIAQLAQQIFAAAPRLPLPPGPDVPPQWVETRVPGLGPNPDNRYLMAPVVWQAGRIVVIRGKAPTFPNTQAGAPPTTPAQLRYWSFDTGANVAPGVTTAGLADFQVPLAADGTYTLVVSQPADKPTNANDVQGVAWLQGSDPSQPDLIILRHMLPSRDHFSQSVWAVPEGVVGAAAAIMGPYYPNITYCAKATFEQGGANACFVASGATPVATPGA